MEKSLIFVSHANPEDNAAAAWFATRLSLLGYDVWCDLRNTHGSETDFWLKVQNKIETEATKFLYILSNVSCDFERKKGIYKELQTADNLRRDNFIIPLRIEPLRRSVPILISTGIYINSENWAEGLCDVVDRLREDNVPLSSNNDRQRVSSWWPALHAESRVLRTEGEDLSSNLLEFEALPKVINFLKVTSDGNIIAGHERLSGALPSATAHYAHGDHAVSFGTAQDFDGAAPNIDISLVANCDVSTFYSEGYDALGIHIEAQAARNMLTYLVAEAFEGFLRSRGLTSKSLTYTRRKIWFPADGLIQGNKRGISERGKRRVPIQLVGSVQHMKKRYMWHFAIQPVIDMHTFSGILLTPKVIIARPYSTARGEKPILVDNLKVLKKVSWWNKEWRQRLSAFTAWLSNDAGQVVIPAGAQQIVLKSTAAEFVAAASYREISDDDLINEVLQNTC